MRFRSIDDTAIMSFGIIEIISLLLALSGFGLRANPKAPTIEGALTSLVIGNNRFSMRRIFPVAGTPTLTQWISQRTP